MTPQFENLVYSSFRYTIDNQLLSTGNAFFNFTGNLYPVTGYAYGFNAYACPFRQLVSDTSIVGANIMSGVWINGVFSVPGQNGIQSINIEEGVVYFNQGYNPTNVSGSFAIKDFSVYLTNEPEGKILFESKYFARPIAPQAFVSGLVPNLKTFPVIYLKVMGGTDLPFAFGGIKNRRTHIRAIVLGDNQFNTDAACSIMRRMVHKYFKIIDTTSLGLDALGGYTGVNYNYQNAITGANLNQSYIESVKVTQFMEARQLNEMNPSLFPAFVDFNLAHFI